MFLLNLIVFVVLFLKLLYRRLVVTDTMKHSNRNDIIIRIWHGFLFWFVFLLSLTFGFLTSVYQETSVFYYVYSICISLQGFLICLMLFIRYITFNKVSKLNRHNSNAKSDSFSGKTRPSFAVSETSQSGVYERETLNLQFV